MAENKEKSEIKKKPKRKKHPFDWLSMLLFATMFQLISMMPVIFSAEELNMEVIGVFGGFILAEWLYFVCARWFAKQRATELEIIAFTLSGIGLVTVASVYPNYALKQLIAILIGLAAFIIFSLPLWGRWISRSERRKRLLSVS